MSNLQRVLYLGMGDDIMAPLLLAPDLTTLFVLDLFDAGHSSDGTRKGQRSDIKGILTHGSDEFSYTAWVYADCDDSFSWDQWRAGAKRPAHVSKAIHSLEGRAEILSEKIDPHACVWRLEFLYNGRVRNLVSFFNHNFMTQTWPNEVCDLSAIMVMGAFAWQDAHANSDCRLFCNMLKDRTRPEFTYFALTFLHETLPNRLCIECGSDREGTEISYVKVVKKGRLSSWIHLIYGC